MKKLIFSLLFLAFCLPARLFSQDVIDEISNATCNCMQKQMDDIKDKSGLQLALGLCVLEASKGKEKELKKKYQIDLDNDPDSGEKLGEQVGMKMVFICPEVFKMLIGDQPSEILGYDEEDTEGRVAETAEGVVEEITANRFLSLTLKDENGNHVEYFWLDVAGDPGTFLDNPEAFLGKKVWVEYETRTVYSPKEKKYILIRVIKALEED